MKVHNLTYTKRLATGEILDLEGEGYLITTFVPDQDDERPVASLDAIIYKRWYTRVELLPHITLS